MKVVINFEFPVEPFNSLIRDGVAGQTISSILEEIKPEAVYFYAPNGCRGGIMIVDMKDSAQIPSIAEPLFLKFGAKCTFDVAMTPEDLGRSGLDKIGKKWS